MVNQDLTPESQWQETHAQWEFNRRCTRQMVQCNRCCCCAWQCVCLCMESGAPNWVSSPNFQHSHGSQKLKEKTHKKKGKK